MAASVVQSVAPWAGTAYAAGTFYVDAGSSSCSSSGPGTEDQPYCTITAALTAHNGPGTTILVKPGTYREQVAIPSSGASGSPFRIQAIGGDVVVDGADDYRSEASWTPSSGAWLAASVTWAPVQVHVDGARLNPWSGSPDSLPPNGFVWVSGAGLYVKLGGDNPGLHETFVGHRLCGFKMFTKSYVTIDGFVITRADNRGVNLQNACTNVTISNNRESLSGGIGMEGVGGSGLVFENNVVWDNHGHGIALISGATGCAIRGNECYGNADPQTRVSNGIYLFHSPANSLSANRLHDNQDTGIHIQTESNDCVSVNNCSWRNGDHGYDHLIATGTIHVGDVAFGNYRDGFSIEGSASGTALSNCIAVDNGLTTNRYDLWIDGNSVPGFTSDYNLFWNSTSKAPIKYVTTIYPTVAGYSAASGQDLHTIQSSPQFVSGADGDFHLLPDSPALDSGDSSAPFWPPSDAEGHSRLDLPSVANTGAGGVPYADRGALERGSMAVDVPASMPAPSPLRVIPNPMHGKGTLRLALERPGHVRIEVLDLMGRLVRTLADREAPAGGLAIDLTAAANDGRPFESGVYFIRVQTPERTLRTRFLVLR